MAGLWTLNPDAMPFQYSVGDAIIFKNIVLEQSGIPFQYSVGDAQYMCRMKIRYATSCLSILRWRCLPKKLMAGIITVVIFQYSVGDAAV